MAQWVECQSVNWKVTSSITSQGTRPGCGPGPQLGMCERQLIDDVSLPFSLPSPLSLKINKILKKKGHNSVGFWYLHKVMQPPPSNSGTFSSLLKDPAPTSSSSLFPTLRPIFPAPAHPWAALCLYGFAFSGHCMEVESHAIQPFVSGSFHLAWRLRGFIHATVCVGASLF